MFTSLSIRNFRGFRDFTVEPLGRVNLIAGANDVGKTALLEAVYLLIGEANLALVVRLNTLRGLDRFQGDPDAIGEWFWMPLFHKFAIHAAIQVEGQTADGGSCRMELKLVPRTSARVSLGDQASREIRGISNGISAQVLQIAYTAAGVQRVSQMVIDEQGFRIEPPPQSSSLPGAFLSAKAGSAAEEDAKYYGDLLIVKEPYDFLRVLQIVEPRLTRVSTILAAGGTILYGDIGLGRMLPLALMGDGLARFASLILRIATARRGVVLVDEIENGLHRSIIRKAWTAVAEAARLFDVQVFATTHSWECIQAAHEAFTASGTYDFSLHRLDLVDDDVRCVTYDQKTLAAALVAELEVR